MDKKSFVEKKIHEEKAHKILTRLAVETINEESLISIVKYIEPYHYEEIVEERFLSKLCGYPICKKHLKNIPTQKYQISSKLNQVLDIGDRKRYCSAVCYKGSKFLESQISSVPIWLRNTPEYLKNDGAKQINLMNYVRSSSSDSKSTCTATAAEKKVYHDDYDLKFNPKPSETRAVKSEYAQQHTQDHVISKSKLLSAEIESELNSIENNWRNKYHVKKSTEATEKEKDPLQKHNIFKHKNVNEREVVSIGSPCSREALQDIEPIENVINKRFIESTLIHCKPKSLYHLGKIFQISNASAASGTTPNQLIIDDNDENSLSKHFFVEYIISRVNALVSDQTKEYILEKKAIEASKVHEERKRVTDLRKFDEYVTETGVLFDNLTNRVSEEAIGVNSVSSSSLEPSGHGINLLKQLDDNGEAEMVAKLELLGFCEQGQESKDLAGSEAQVEQKAEGKVDAANCQYRKPLPNYEQIKSEAKQQQLKIKEFFIGDPHSQMAKKSKEREVLHAEMEEMSRDKALSANMFKMRAEGEHEIIRVLPTVDAQFQMEVRRKIFYEKLIKYLDQILKFNDYSMGDVKFMNHIKNFVFSLRLDNQNILFNANEWPIVSLFMLKILSLKQTNSSLAEPIKSDEYDNSLAATLTNMIRQNKLIETLLVSFKLDCEQLDKICIYLVN